MTILDTARGLIPLRRTIRIGVTGLARAGKTSFLTSLAANLLAAGAGHATLPALSQRLAGRALRVALAPAGAAARANFDYRGKLAALAEDPPAWPQATSGVAVLALDIELGRSGITAALPPQQIRLELLDYPGEWLLDLPLLGVSFAKWSAQTLRRLESRPEASAFRAYAMGLPAAAPEDETLAQAGHGLYRAALHRMRAEAGLSLLQPGRFLMPAPGEAPAYESFFPLPGTSRLAGLLARRYDAYVAAVAHDLAAPSFGRIDRMVVLADILSALHRGEAAFADASAALAAVAAALRWRRAPGFLPDWLAGLLPIGGIGRVAFAATKSDHVADRQRGNLANLVTSLTALPGGAAMQGFALASIRATEDFVWTLDGRPVSAVRGRLLGDERLARSYPGEVPDRAPAADFWAHAFLALPEFEPLRLPMAGRGGVPHINLDKLLCFLLEDVL